ncbi:restriction endonuclease subunit S [Alicyclobacillus mengziensis]|uniref:Restriction endonuclease subunit S n=1 Tax=Alicyclobacillus mengziensis TaxID=2931921 RepID=A0A9X7Z7L0_9BACL|nr:restriction endonuclease subunit S [Alicyclobacillus mengziensis]QSO49189.1 restriction endonuclease subunit S [Alicyclobacillus mengziensis]
MKRLRDLCNFKNGLWTGSKLPLLKMRVLRNTDFTLDGYLTFENVAEIEVEESQYLERRVEPNDILLEKSGGSPSQAIGRVAFYTGNSNEFSFGNFIARIRPVDTKQLLPKYLWACLNDFYQQGGTVSLQGGMRILNLDFEGYKNIKIPLPPKSVQEQIIEEITDIEQKDKTGQAKLIELKNQLTHLFSDLNYPSEKLGNLAEFKNGLNYNEDSTGDLVTVVGVKDFLENFSPNLDNLEDVRIDGKLKESYKLQPEDILVVRSNGSANLVGRFIYIDKVLKDLSYSGFTIRIRTNSEKVNPKYLCYCLRTESVRNAITKDPQGANIKSVNQTMLSSIKIPLPDINEQLTIMNRAEELERQISAIKRELDNVNNEKELVLRKHLE